MPDAKVFMDAGVDAAPLCGTMSAAQPLGLGTMQMPRAGDYFVTPTMGPQMGKVVFALGAGLPGSTATAADAFFIEVVKPSGGFATNTPYTFETNGTVSNYVAAAYILEDLNQMAMPPTYARVYWASSGSVTFTQIGETMGSLVNGSVAATNLREINDMTGADVAGGCMVSLAGLSFNLTQNMNKAEFPSWSEPGAITLTPEQIGALLDDVKTKHGLQ